MNDNSAPWPRFRGGMHQTGRASGALGPGHGQRWHYPQEEPPEKLGNAARGIFNSAVVTADGCIWSGSASGSLLGFNGAGECKHTLQVDGLVDTTPLLLGTALYVSCGDGWIYRCNPIGSAPSKWFYAKPQQGAFINWFEGHLGLDGQGRIVAPNDNRLVYAIDPNDPAKFQTYQMGDQGWSLPCTDDQSRIFFGNNAIPVKDRPAFNLYGANAQGIFWQIATRGSVVASPAWHNGWLYAGSFDGSLYAFFFTPGFQPPLKPAWTFQARDHLYASPAVQRDGTVIQCGCDGTVYALEGTTGRLKWRYDTQPLNPIRSSPAIDDAGNIWVGLGDGRVLVLSADGLSRHYEELSIPGPRLEVNASPALLPGGVAIGDSEGRLHYLPWVHPQESTANEEGVRKDGAQARFWSAGLLATDVWGINRSLPPQTLRPGDTLCFTLDAREWEHGLKPDAGLGLLHKVEPPNPQWECRVSGDRRYMLVRPAPSVVAGPLELDLTVEWVYGPDRHGLRMSGGTRGPDFRFHHSFEVQAPGRGPAAPPHTIWLQRIAMSLPMLMPSYNQIGFETLVYSIGRVRQISANEWLYWLVGCQADSHPDVGTKVRFPLVGRYDPSTGTLALDGSGIVSELNGFRTQLIDFSLTCWFVEGQDPSQQAPCMRMSFLPGNVEFYGAYLEALGMGDETHPVEILGSGDIRTDAAHPLPHIVARWRITASGDIAVDCSAPESLEKKTLSILLQDESGRPFITDYAWDLTRGGSATNPTVVLDKPAGGWPAKPTVWLIANTEPILAQRV